MQESGFPAGLRVGEIVDFGRGLYPSPGGPRGRAGALAAAAHRRTGRTA